MKSFVAPQGVYDEVTEFVDFRLLGHDVNRVIVKRHWVPEALLYLILSRYFTWIFTIFIK